MSNRVAQEVAEIWHLEKGQKVGFEAAMREELPCELREVCGKGCFILSLCMNEISSIYDHMKSPVDGVLVQPGAKYSVVSSNMDAATSPDEIMQLLHHNQFRLLDKYLTILKHFEGTGSYQAMLKDHIFILKRLAEKLQMPGEDLVTNSTG